MGHPPGASPYHDIPRTAGPVLAVGFLAGEEGKVGVGITNATTIGVRYDLPVGGALRLAFGGSYALGERFLVDPTADSASRKSGPESDAFFLVEGEVQLLLTGHKTWRGFAPYLVAGAGFAAGGGEPAADTSDYRFGTKAMYNGGAGLRWYPARRLSVQLDARAVLMKLRYPQQYYLPAADGTAVLNFTDDSDEWTRQPWFRVSIGWTF